MAIRKRKIESIVQDLLSKYKIKDAPIPVERIAKGCGAKIFYQSLDNDLSGFMYREKSNGLIGVNTHHPAVRQNFTTAHELGHFLLHDQEQVHVDREIRTPLHLRSKVSSEGTNELEREANYFAACLLMPSEFIERDLVDEEYVDLLDDDFLCKLARKYRVSTQALIIRLKNLDYIQE